MDEAGDAEERHAEERQRRRVGGLGRGHEVLGLARGQRAGHAVDDRDAEQHSRQPEPHDARCDAGDGPPAVASATPARATSTGTPLTMMTTRSSGPAGPIGGGDGHRRRRPERHQADGQRAHRATVGGEVAHRPRQHSAATERVVPRTIAAPWRGRIGTRSRRPRLPRGARPAVSRPFVSLLSDFGRAIRRPASCARSWRASARPPVVVDLAHDVDKFAIRDGALLLWSAVPYLPIGAHVAVVDPGVGTERKGIAIQAARGDFLVGPDNGLLMPAAARLGGITHAHLLENPRYSLPDVSSSFHGRDVFAPAAAHLADGRPHRGAGASRRPAPAAGPGVAAAGHPCPAGCATQADLHRHLRQRQALGARRGPGRRPSRSCGSGRQLAHPDRGRRLQPRAARHVGPGLR